MPQLPNVIIRMTNLTAIFASILTAIGMPSDWHSLSFRSIPSIQSKVQKDKITLEVDASAGGLVRRLPAGTRMKRFIVTGSVTGQLKVDEKRLWEKGNEDAYLRVGLIAEGGRSLTTFERLVAPAWICTMDDVLCADGRAPSAIRNHLLVPHFSWIGKQRANPNMKQLVDHMVATPGADGRFTMAVDLPQPMNVLGLWLMADGDDSGSKFEVIIDSIQLESP